MKKPQLTTNHIEQASALLGFTLSSIYVAASVTAFTAALPVLVVYALYKRSKEEEKD